MNHFIIRCHRAERWQHILLVCSSKVFGEGNNIMHTSTISDIPKWKLCRGLIVNRQCISRSIHRTRNKPFSWKDLQRVRGNICRIPSAFSVKVHSFACTQFDQGLPALILSQGTSILTSSLYFIQRQTTCTIAATSYLISLRHAHGYSTDVLCFTYDSL